MAAAQAALESIPEDKILGATPYRYVTVQMTRNQLSFVTAGTDFSQVQLTSPYFVVEGAYPSGSRQILLGKEVAETIGAKVNSVIELSYRPAETASAGSEIIPGVLLTGSAVGFNNNPVYVTLKVDEDLRITELTVNADTQTPEYGGQCAEPFFTQRFIGKQIPVTLNEDVDAVTGATMTSQAVADAINHSGAAETPAALLLRLRLSTHRHLLRPKRILRKTLQVPLEKRKAQGRTAPLRREQLLRRPLPQKRKRSPPKTFPSHGKTAMSTLS